MPPPIKDIFSNPVAGLDPYQLFWQAVIASILSFLLGLVVSVVYKRTHSGTSYSQNFCHVLVVMAVLVSLVMIVIGSNIARAFSLVGALSIIRYRTAVKDARDTMFVFFAMMIGMACGVGLRQIAVFATFFLAAVIFLLYRTNFGTIHTNFGILKFTVPPGFDFDNEVEPALKKLSMSLDLISTESIRDGTALEVTYRILPNPEVRPAALLDTVRQKTGNEHVLYFPADPSASES